ncbi:MAG: hypothetical protein Q4F56_03280, partial [Candidatus Saccharibacteria bacterium]|nr:hypothetical protein [Candidatus Saccharibacteria bacterium]
MNNNSRRYMDFAPKRGGGSGGRRSIVVREEERKIVATRVAGPRPIKVRSTTQISVRSLDDRPKAMLMPKKEVKIPVPVAPRRRVNDMVVSKKGQTTRSVVVETRKEQKPAPKKKMPVMVHRAEPVLGVKSEDKPIKPAKVEKEEVNVFDEFPAPLDIDALDFGDEEDEGDDYWDRDLGVIEDIDPISDKEIAEGADVVVATNEM